MGITGLQELEIWRDCLDSGTSDSLAEIITDDFVFVSPNGGTRSRDETLNFTENAMTHISDFDVVMKTMR